LLVGAPWIEHLHSGRTDRIRIFGKLRQQIAVERVIGGFKENHLATIVGTQYTNAIGKVSP
jgi:hypothetical protein